MDVSDLKRRVSRHFFDLVDEDANPLVVALALQDNSSVGLQHYSDEFRELHEELRQVLRSRVEQSYQGFNESVGVYRQVVGSLKSGHETVQGSKGEMEKLHESFSRRRPILKELHERSVRFKRKLEILADLETLKELPSKFEGSVASKDFGEARVQLSHALEIVNSRNLIGQSAIKPMHDYVQTQRTQLVAKLVDEMHATIYLESPYSQKRLEPDNKDYEDFMRGLPTLPESSRLNPEENSFAYLGMLMQTLASLQSLGTSLDSLLRTAHAHLHQICVNTSIEVISDLKLTPESMQRATHGQTLLDQFRFIDKGALTTLAVSLFAKLTKFMEAQRAVAEIAAQFGVVYDMDRVCTIVISTVKTFLLSYIGGQPGATPGYGRRNRPPMQRQPTNDTSSRLSRSRQDGHVFEFGPDDEDTKGLRDFETLRESLKESIPGLLADDPSHLYAETQQQERLEVVAPPHILNIWPLLEPSAQFFENAHKIAQTPKSRKDFTEFLDTFLQHSFIPRLQEAFNDAVDDIVDDPSALDEMRNWKAVSQLPIANCSAKFVETLGLLSQLLDTGTSYREDYSNILVGLLSRIVSFFTARLENLFKLATVGTESGSSTSSNSRRLFRVWDYVAKTPGLLGFMRDHFDNNVRTESLGKEFQVYFSRRRTPRSPKTQISISDLLDMRLFQQAALLITSVRWFVVRLRKMRRVATVDASKTSDHFSTRVRKRWFLLDSSTYPTVGSATSSSTSTAFEYNTVADASVMLYGRCLTEFDEGISSLEDYTFRALCSLRADKFLRIVYYFDQMIMNRDFHSSDRGEERDPVLDLLQQELSLASQVLEGNLIKADYKFLLGGIPSFMNELFILEGENINDMNEGGQSQILTNIFALQQMLTSIVDDPRKVNFSRATTFYELFRLNPTLIIDKARDGETDDLDRDDLALLLKIRHRNASGATTSHAFGTLSAHLAQLDNIFNGDKTGSSSTTNAVSSAKAPASASTTTAPAKSAGATSATATSASAVKAASAPGVQPAASSTTAGPSSAATNAAKPARVPSVEPLRPKSSRSQSPEKTGTSKPGQESNSPGPQLPPRSPNQDQNRLSRLRTEAGSSAAAQKPREDREQLIAEQKRQQLAEQKKQQLEEKRLREQELQRAAQAEKLRREHELQSAAQAEKLKREREALKSRSQESLDLGQRRSSEPQASVPRQAARPQQAQTDATAAASPVGVKATDQNPSHTAPLTAAAPSSNAARSPLLNHRPRFESHQHQQQAQEPESKSQQPPRPTHRPQQSQQRSEQPTAQPVPPRTQSSQQRRPSAMSVNTSLPPRRESAPKTPDQPSGRERPRTPSEKALEAAQRVKVRQLPQTSRRPS